MVGRILTMTQVEVAAAQVAQASTVLELSEETAEQASHRPLQVPALLEAAEVEPVNS